MRGISFHALNRNRQSYDANDDDFTEITRLQNLNAGAKLFNHFTDRHKLTAELNMSDEDRRGGNKLDLPEHLADIAESIRTKVIGGGLTKEHIWVLGGQHTYYLPTAKGQLQLTSGAEFNHDVLSETRQNPNILTINQKSNTFGLFSQADWKISPKFKLLGGLRLDHVNASLLKESITVLNPRASALYNINENFILRGSYARGFRAPMFYSEDVHSELITGEVRRVKLAENLKKETSDSYTASFEYNHTHDTHQLIAMIEGFYTALHDRFDYEEKKTASV